MEQWKPNGDIYFDPWDEIRHTHNRLPHWQQPGAAYFVTWRLLDSLPKAWLQWHRQERDDWLKFHPQPWSSEVEAEYHNRFSRQIDDKLDQGHGSCLLRQARNGREVVKVVEFFEGKRTILVSIVVMPNHVHTLFVLHASWTLEQILHSWKRQSSLEINRLQGRTGNLWQRDYFDRMIRDHEHFANCVRYIRRNPAKANLPREDYQLIESDAALQIESRTR